MQAAVTLATGQLGKEKKRSSWITGCRVGGTFATIPTFRLLRCLNCPRCCYGTESSIQRRARACTCACTRVFSMFLGYSARFLTVSYSVKNRLTLTNDSIKEAGHCNNSRVTDCMCGALRVECSSKLCVSRRQPSPFLHHVSVGKIKMSAKKHTSQRHFY